MFEKILGKSKKEAGNNKDHTIIVDKVSRMNLVDMRVYVNNKLSDLKISEDGLTEVMRKLISIDSKNKRFIESDAMDSKIKKAFDLVIMIAGSKKITVNTLELIQDFIDMYDDIIVKFDQDNKEIYASKLKVALNACLTNLASISEFNNKMGILGK